MEIKNLKFPPKLGGKKDTGQVMLISVLIVGGIMAAAIAVSFVFLLEIRLARQTPDSVKAIYAADAGIECSLYKYFKSPEQICDSAAVIFWNGASFEARTETAPGTATTSVSIGESNEVRRSLEVEIPVI